MTPRTVAVALLLTTQVVACTSSRAGEPLPAGSARVATVVDGDTVVLDLSDGREHVRLLGIDTPETSHPTRPVECFGAEATARLTELIPPGSVVRLERDVEGRDHYGRLLLYLYRADDDLFVNEALVNEGFAVALPVDPNDAHRTTFAAAQQQARADQRGLWEACGGPDVALDPLRAR
ncbi:MAG: thermonuclease family protein [Acidimicrobiales bacterium]